MPGVSVLIFFVSGRGWQFCDLRRCLERQHRASGPPQFRAGNKKPRTKPGLSLVHGEKLVVRRHRACTPAEAVVDPQGHHVHVLADPVIGDGYEARVGHGEGVVCISHPQMVVFGAD